MIKLSIWNRLGISNDVVKKSDSLARDNDRFEREERPKAERRAAEIGEKAWELHERWRKAQIAKNEDIRPLFEQYSRLSHDQDEVMAAYHRELEKSRREQEDLMRPLIAESILMIDEELDKLPERYVCKVPHVRVHPVTGKDLPPERVDVDTDTRWLDIETNASSIRKGQEFLTLGKQKVRQARSVKSLQNVLDTLEKEFASLDFEPVAVSVRSDEFEKVSTYRPSEVAYLLGDGEVVRPRPQAKPSDLFHVPR